MANIKTLEVMRDELKQVFPAGEVYDDTCRKAAQYAEKALYQRWREYALADMALKEAEDVIGMSAELAGDKLSAKKKANLEKFANKAMREYARYRMAIHDNFIKGPPKEPESADLAEQVAYKSVSMRFDLWQKARLEGLDKRTEQVDEKIKQMRKNGFSVGVSVEHYADTDVEENPERAAFYKLLKDSVTEVRHTIPMHQ